MGTLLAGHDALRRERSSAQSTAAGFRSTTKLDDSPQTTRLTQLAVERAKQGDEEALRFLYVQYSNNIYGYVRSIVRDDHDAEDVTQHVFAKLMTSIGKYDDRGVPFFAWLLRLARNVAIDHLRSMRATPVEEVVSPDAEFEEELDDVMAIRDAPRDAPSRTARGRVPAPRRRPLTRRDRRQAGQDGGVHSRTPPSRPTDAPAGAVAARARADRHRATVVGSLTGAGPGLNLAAACSAPGIRPGRRMRVVQNPRRHLGVSDPCHRVVVSRGLTESQGSVHTFLWRLPWRPNS